MNTRLRTLRAFTLVELLVVIAIIGTLMGLLLPAVQSAREAGRRNTCSNNLNQLGKAVVAYDGQRSQVPGWRNAVNNVAVSWPVVLLPNIERSDVYDLYESNNSGTAQMPYISLFTCPTSPPDSVTDPTLAYAGNGGTGFIAAGRQIKGDGVLLDTVGDAGYSKTRTNLDQISSGDGTSNTLLFSEKCGSLTPQAFSNVQPAAFHGFSGNQTDRAFAFTAGPGSLPVFGVAPNSMQGLTAVSGSTPLRYQVLDGAEYANCPPVINSTVVGDIADSSTYNNGYASVPSSNHPSGVVATFCDGHTVFLRDNISPHVYAQLVSSNSEWKNSDHTANSVPMNQWLRTSPTVPYLLSEGDYR